jgi:Fur family ferric uptake transcriptional regulator
MSKHSIVEGVDVGQTPWQLFEVYLQSRGMRNTEQRRLLVQHIFSYHQHFDADQLIDQLPSRGKKGHVSRPTVYRALAEFVDAGLLRRIELDGRAVYEPAHGYQQHDHLYCQQCRRLYEFQSTALVALCDRVALEQQFQVTGRRILIYGICGRCATPKRPVKRGHRLSAQVKRSCRCRADARRT